MAEELKLKKKSEWKKTKIPFGKHKGRTIRAVGEQWPEYLGWAITNEVQWFLQHIPSKKHDNFVNYYKMDNLYTPTNGYGEQMDYDEHDYDITAYDLCIGEWGD